MSIDPFVKGPKGDPLRSYPGLIGQQIARGVVNIVTKV
jgi:hypothetical protein